MNQAPVNDVSSDATTSDEARSGDGDGGGNGGGASSRRALMGRGAAAIAGVAVGAIATSSRVSAADGSQVLVGNPHTGTSTTGFSGGTTVRVDDGTSSELSSVQGVHSVDGATGVRGDATGASGRGVFGGATGIGGYGVFGQFVGDGDPGTGVYGISNDGGGVVGVSTEGVGVVGEGTSWDVYANSSGRIGLEASDVGPTTPGGVGTLARDPDGTLWYCFAPNRWQRLSGVSLSGGYTAIDPVRVFDSRNAGFPNSGAFSPFEARVIPIADGRNGLTGAVTTPDAVPVGATAITYNVTIDGTTAAGFLSVVPGDVESTDTSTINWTGPAATIANGTQSRIDPLRRLRLIAGPFATFHAIVDVTGYYL